MYARLLTVILATAALVGCRDSGDDDDDNRADAGGDEVTIYEVQDGTIGNGEAVTLRGDVVVAIDNFGDSRGSIWIAEPDEHPTYGRAFGGVQVFTTDISQVAGLVVGDLVDIEGGAVDEFALNCGDAEVDCSDTLQTLTEISGTLTITKVGDGTVPDPVVVLPQDLGADANEAEKWESVLIKLDNVAATSNPRDIGSDTTLKEIRITGPFRVQSALADLGDVARDDCYTSITGLGNYFFDYKLLPRSANDIVKAADTSACLYETQAAECDDGLDNDFDGFADCGDFSCQDANPVLCTVDGGVVAIQDGTIAENTLVALTGVVVTAVSDDGRVWVKDAGNSNDYNGIQVYRGTSPSTLDVQIVVGATVDVIGTISEFGTPFDSPTSFETEIEVDTGATDVAFDSGGAAPDARNDVAAGTLAHADNGEPYEGMLVELTNVKVSNPDAGFGEFIVTDGTNTLHVDDLIFNYAMPAADTCYATLRGVMGETFGNRKLTPRSAADMVTGGTCP